MAYDAAIGRVILFGGAPNPITRLDDTWVWDGVSWTQLNIAGPSRRAVHAIAYDTAAQRTVFFGGVVSSGTHAGDTWFLQAPACLADISPGPSGDGSVNIDDLLAVISAWGPCPAPPTSCPANIALSGVGATSVDVDDLLAVISAWGSCP